MTLPARSTLLGGLSGLAVWALGLLLEYLNIKVPQDAVGGAVAVVSALVVHFTPDSLKSQAEALNVNVENLAQWLPEAKYPD